MLRLAVRRERQEHRLITKASTRRIKSATTGVVVAGEGILHHQHHLPFCSALSASGCSRSYWRSGGRPSAASATAPETAADRPSPICFSDSFFSQGWLIKKFKGLRRLPAPSAARQIRPRHQMIRAPAADAAVVQLQEARARTRGTSILIGHWVEQALQARQPDIASLTSCSHIRLCAHASCCACAPPATQADALLRHFSSWLGSTPRSASRRGCLPASPAFRRVLVADFHRRTHRALDVQKLKHNPLPLHSIAHASCCACRDGDLPIQVPRFAASTFIIGASIPSGELDFPGFRRVIGIEDRDLAQLGIQRLAKEGRAGLAEPLPCSPHSRPPYFAVSYHLVGDLLHQHLLLRIAHVQRRAHVQHPASTWPNMP